MNVDDSFSNNCLEVGVVEGDIRGIGVDRGVTERVVGSPTLADSFIRNATIAHRPGTLLRVKRPWYAFFTLGWRGELRHVLQL